MTLSWLHKALIAMLCFVPLYLAIGFVYKNYQIKAEVTLLIWLIGITLGMGYWILSKPDVVASINYDKTTLVVYLVLFIIAISFGTIANVFTSQSVVEAPNPGLPVAIVNTSSVIVFAFAYIFSLVLPTLFPVTQMDYGKLIGIFLTLGGLYLISK